MAEGEKQLVVAYLGPVASYTHQATLTTFPPSNTNYKLTPCTTIEDVFASVQSGTAARGVVPFENSSNGSVVFTLDLFADVEKKYQDIRVCGEVYVRVSHCLLGFNSQSTSGDTTTQNEVKGGSEGGTGFEHITKLYSHPQAWGQCKTFLDTHLKGVERHDVSSTSRAAEIVAQSGDKSAAALSSRVAAGVFGLAVLQEGIEDRADNVTRFFVLEKGDKNEEISTLKEEGIQESGEEVKSEDGKDKRKEQEKEFKTLLTFTISHANPGALAQSLSVFEKYGLNLTSINTRPSGVENWNYIFFVEIKGRRDGEGEEEGAVNKALRDLSKVCKGWRWLGSWENGLKR